MRMMRLFNALSVLIVVNMRRDRWAGDSRRSVERRLPSSRLGFDVRRSERAVQPRSNLSTHHYAYETAMEPIVFANRNLLFESNRLCQGDKRMCI